MISCLSVILKTQAVYYLGLAKTTVVDDEFWGYPKSRCHQSTIKIYKQIQKMKSPSVLIFVFYLMQTINYRNGQSLLCNKINEACNYTPSRNNLRYGTLTSKTYSKERHLGISSSSLWWLWESVDSNHRVDSLSLIGRHLSISAKYVLPLNYFPICRSFPAVRYMLGTHAVNAANHFVDAAPIKELHPGHAKTDT